MIMLILFIVFAAVCILLYKKQDNVMNDLKFDLAAAKRDRNAAEEELDIYKELYFELMAEITDEKFKNKHHKTTKMKVADELAVPDVIKNQLKADKIIICNNHSGTFEIEAIRYNV